MQAAALNRMHLGRRVVGRRTPATDRFLIRLGLVLVLFMTGLGIVTDIGTMSSGRLPIRWVEIPVFPNSPLVTALTLRGPVTDDLTYDVILDPPEFFESVHRADDILRSGAYFAVVFVLVEYHYHDGLYNTFSTTLVIDGGRYSRPVPLQLWDDGHNRITAQSFPDLSLSMLMELHLFEMPLLADADGHQQVLVWETPLDLPTTAPS